MVPSNKKDTECQANSDGSEVNLINHLCDIVLSDFTINKELLFKWQVELVDIMHDNAVLSSIIEEELVISFPTNRITNSISRSDVEYLLNALNELEDDIYNDLKLILLELFLYAISVSYTTKIKMFRTNVHELLIDNFLKLLSDKELEPMTDFNTPSSLGQYARLIIIFCEFGCDIKLLRKLILPLFNHSIRTTSRLFLLELLNQIFKKYPCHFNFFVLNDFQNSAVAIPFTKDLNSSKCLTIQSAFKVNSTCMDTKLNDDNIPTSTLFLLANSSGGNSSTLRVQLMNYNQFMIEIKNHQTGSRMQFSFNQLLNPYNSRNQNYTHFTLTYDTYANLNLYIDGEYSESIPCPELYKILTSWNKIYIGEDNPNAFGNNKDELIIRNLIVLNIPMSYEWINLLYNLGLGYECDFKDITNDRLLNILNHLNYKGLMNLGLKIKELRGNRERENSDVLSSETQGVGDLKLKRKSNGSGMSGNQIFQVLSASKLTKENILFDSNDSIFIDSLESPNSPKILVHKSRSIHCALYSIGGSSLLLKLIESYSQASDSKDSKLRDTILFKSLNLLFCILNNNWRLNKEFENINGYGLLSILLMRYKDTVNKSLKFEVLSGYELNKSTGNDNNQDLLKLILTFTGYDFVNPYHSIIINPTGYRFLILNFELFFESDTFEFLLYHFQVLINESKYKSINISELAKMKLLRKLIQFLKSPVLASYAPEQPVCDQLSSTINCIVRVDPSVETIRTISLFVIYSLYHNSQDCYERIGVITLKSLSDVLCDPNTSIKVLKKFSRSITIHWILLLLNFKSNHNNNYTKEVVKCGLRLLAKLLKVLGTHIIKRFFQVNHGLDILTHFLKDWWSNDDVVCLLYFASFGIDIKQVEKSSMNLNQALSDTNNKLTQLIIPEFLILLNNLVLNSMNTLSMNQGKSLSASSSPIKSKKKISNSSEISYDTLHLVNQYLEAINFGFENIKLIKEFYIKKDWLEGIFELLGYLRLSISWTNFELTATFNSSYNELIKILTNIFVSKLLKSSEFFDILNSLSDFTKKLILDIIFPRIFEHVNQFINVSNFIFQEKEFLEGTIDILNYYHSAYVDQNYLVEENDLDIFMACVISIIETNDASKITSKTSGIKKLKKCWGEITLIKFMKISEAFKIESERHDDNNLSELGPKLNDSLKWLLYRQVVILQKDVLTNEKISDLISLLLGDFFKLLSEDQLSSAEYIFNFLRTCYIMRQDDFHGITRKLSRDNDYQECESLITELFDNLLTKNDEESLRSLQKYPTFKHIFTKNFHACFGRAEKNAILKVVDMVGVTLNNGGRLGYMNNVYIRTFENDCEQLKLLLINGESIKFNRAVQDKQENVQFYVSTYNSLKIEVARLIDQEFLYQTKSHYVLDYIENVDRMRKRMIVENQLSESEKLSYNINIPIKQVEPIDGEFKPIEDYDYSNSRNEFEELIDGIDDNFEIIDDGSDTIDSETSAYEDKNRKVIRSLYMGDQIVALWNISQINGLAPIESLMILGSGHLYLIENYWHCNNGNVIDAQDAPLELRDPYLQLVNSQSNSHMKTDNGKSHRTKSWGLEKLCCISKRQFLLRDIALELFFSDGASILITCLSIKERDSVYHKLYSYASWKGLDSDLLVALQISSSTMTANHSLSSGTSNFATKLASALTGGTSSLLAATKKWKMGEMSNFYYLIIINTLAGRTFNDLTQYPVFPWVIADYTSETLDLSNPKSFRDLSKPMGAQTKTRSQEFHERYEALDSLQDHNAPPFHYGTHYSSAMIVTSFLIRLKPYVQSYLLLQGGKFDHADRLFNSVEKAWSSASKDNTTDVRELTPEFFYLPEFLVNSSHFEFGKLQNGQSSNDVILPSWAKGDPKIFISKNREALESPYVSANLHHWIELIFGHKQSGPEAVKSLNVFHHLSYNGAINLDSINDDLEKRAIIGMINNFGQTPMKVFQKPHPLKEVLNIPNQYMNPVVAENKPRLVFDSKFKAPIEKLELNLKDKKWVGRPSCISCEDDLIIKKTNQFNTNCGSLAINQMRFLNIHSSNITCLLQIGHKLLLTASEDGIINVWKCNLKPATNLQFQCVLRGHFTEVSLLKFSRSYKIGLSADIDGIIILWDFTRFKFVRRFTPPIMDETPGVLATISNDTGNVAIIYSLNDKNLLTIYTLNGETILSKELERGCISSITFGSINNPMVDTDKCSTTNCHVYWSNELIAICYESPTKLIAIYELSIDDRENGGWTLNQMDSINFAHTSISKITAIELFKQNSIDEEDKLCRGSLKFILGDSSGKVYSW